MGAAKGFGINSLLPDIMFSADWIAFQKKMGLCDPFFLLPNILYIKQFVEGRIIVEEPNTSIADKVLKEATMAQMLTIGDMDTGPVDPGDIQSEFLKLSGVSFKDNNGDDIGIPDDLTTLIDNDPQSDTFGKISDTDADKWSDVNMSVDQNRPGGSNGLHALEKALVMSIQDSQKPWFEAIRVFLKILCTVESIISQVTPFVFGSVATPESSTIGGKPNTLCSGLVDDAISNLDGILSKIPNISKDGKRDKKPRNVAPGGPKGNVQEQGDFTYTVISEVYSTGTKIEGVNYNVTYINICPDETNLPLEEAPSTDTGDRIKNLPETIIFGVWDSKKKRISNPPQWITGIDDQPSKWFGEFILQDVSGGVYEALQADVPDIETKEVDGKDELDFKGIYAISSVTKLKDDAPSDLNKTLISAINSFKAQTIKQITVKHQKLVKKGLNPPSVEKLTEEVFSRMTYADALIYLKTLSGENDRGETNYFANLPLENNEGLEGGFFIPRLITHKGIEELADPEADYKLRLIRFDKKEDGDSDDWKKQNDKYRNLNLFAGKGGAFPSGASNYNHKAFENEALQLTALNRYYDAGDSGSNSGNNDVTWVIEGVRKDIVGEAKRPDTPPGQPAEADCFIPPFSIFGAIGSFIELIIAIVIEMVPKLTEVIKLFTNPPEFLTSIILEKLEENFDFLTVFPDLKTLMEIARQNPEELAKTPPSGYSFDSFGGLAPTIAEGTTSPPDNPDIPDTNGAKFLNKKEELLSKVDKIFLDNPHTKQFIFFDKDTFELDFLMSGIASLDLFPGVLSFGLSHDPDPFDPATFAPGDGGIGITTNGVPFSSGFTAGTPFIVINEFDFKKICDVVLDPDKNQNERAPKKNASTGNAAQAGSGERVITESDKSKLEQENSLHIIYSTGTFQEGVDYTWIYLDDPIYSLLSEADELTRLAEENNDRELAKKAYVILLKANKKDPNSGVVKDRLQKLSKNFKIRPHMLFSFMMSLVSLPIKLIIKKICFFIQFFENLSLFTLPVDIVKFLSFGWLFEDMEIGSKDGEPLEYKAFMTPKGILNLLGFNFDPGTLIEWLAKIPELLAEIEKLADEIKQLGIAAVSGITGITDAIGDLVGKFLPECTPANRSHDITPDDVAKALQLAMDQLDALKNIKFDLTEILSVPFFFDLPTVGIEDLEVIGKKPIAQITQFFKLISTIINAIIKFIFSLMGLGSILPCPENDYSEFVSKALSKEEQREKGTFVPDELNKPISSADKNNFLYEVRYSNGNVELLDLQGLRSELNENPNVDYTFIGAGIDLGPEAKERSDALTSFTSTEQTARGLKAGRAQAAKDLKEIEIRKNQKLREDRERKKLADISFRTEKERKERVSATSVILITSPPDGFVASSLDTGGKLQVRWEILDSSILDGSKYKIRVLVYEPGVNIQNNNISGAQIRQFRSVVAGGPNIGIKNDSDAVSDIIIDPIPNSGISQSAGGGNKYGPGMVTHLTGNFEKGKTYKVDVRLISAQEFLIGASVQTVWKVGNKKGYDIVEITIP